MTVVAVSRECVKIMNHTTVKRELASEFASNAGCTKNKFAMSSFKSWFEKSRLPREDEEETERASIPSRGTEDGSNISTFFGGTPQTDEEKDLESAGLLSSWSDRWTRATQPAESEWTCGLSRCVSPLYIS